MKLLMMGKRSEDQLIQVLLQIKDYALRITSLLLGESDSNRDLSYVTIPQFRPYLTCKKLNKECANL